MSNPVANGVYVDTYDKTIYFKDDALTETGVSFTDNAGGFKFALLDTQDTTAADIWSYAGTTATYKNATPAHYTLTDQTHITYALALDSGVTQAKDAVSGDNWVKVGENYAFKQGITPAYYILTPTTLLPARRQPTAPPLSR